MVVTIPHAEIWHYDELEKDLRHRIATQPSNAPLFQYEQRHKKKTIPVDVARIDAVLTTISREAGHEFNLSSYSFRFRFIIQCVQGNTDSRGYVNWDNVKQRTGHMDEKTLMNSYDRLGLHPPSI